MFITRGTYPLRVGIPLAQGELHGSREPQPAKKVQRSRRDLHDRGESQAGARSRDETAGREPNGTQRRLAKESRG